MSRIATFCADYLGKHGPAPVETIYQAAYAAGVTTARNSASVTQAMRYRSTFLQLPDGRYTCAQRLLVGAVFTHRVSGDRAGDEYVWPGPELEPLRKLVKDFGEVPVEGGGTVRVDRYGQEAWRVPPGILAAVPRNGLLGFSWTGTELRAIPVEIDIDRDDPKALEVRAVLIRHRRRALDANGDFGYRRWYPPEDVGRLVLNALAEVPDLFAGPVVPLDELIGPSPAECVDALHRSVSDGIVPEHRIKVTLDMPEPLYAELESRAAKLKIEPNEFLVGYLALHMWSTAPREAVPYEPRYASKQRHLSAVPNMEDEIWAG